MNPSRTSRVLPLWKLYEAATAHPRDWKGSICHPVSSNVYCEHGSHRDSFTPAQLCCCQLYLLWMFFTWCLVKGTIIDDNNNIPESLHESLGRSGFFFLFTVQSVENNNWFPGYFNFVPRCTRSASGTESTVVTAGDHRPARSFRSSQRHFRREAALWWVFITVPQHLPEMIVAGNWGSEWRRPLGAMSDRKVQWWKRQARIMWKKNRIN